MLNWTNLQRGDAVKFEIIEMDMIKTINNPETDEHGLRSLKLGRG